MRLVGLAILAGLLAGCRGADTSWMPLNTGRSWTYQAWSAGETRIADYRVGKRVPVGDATGVELEGTMGTSRLAWREGRLITTELAQARVSPPLPYLVPGVKEVTWSGFVNTLGVAERATAVLQNEAETLTDDGVKRATQRATLTVQILGRPGRPPRRIILDTWFQRGVGIVRQDQRTEVRGSPDLDVRLTLVRE